MTIPHNKPTIGQKEINAVTKVLKSDWLIAGHEVEKFENAVKKHTNRTYAIATNSGHSALHLSLLALGIKPGDEVIMPSYTVSDILNTIFYVGAKPVLVDADDQSVNVTKQEVAKKITRKTKALIVPHMLGLAAPIAELKTLGIPVIEDAAQAMGTRINGKPVGSFGELSIFSFFATKMITTAGLGGMILTDDSKQYNYIKNLLDYNAPTSFAVHYNYVMTDVEASMGNIQMKRLSEFIRRKKHIAAMYKKIFDKKGISYSPEKNDRNANYYRFVIQFKQEKNRNDVMKKLAKKGITTKPPLKYKELPHVLLKLPDKQFPNTVTYANTLLSLPLFPSLTTTEIKYITQTLDAIL